MLPFFSEIFMLKQKKFDPFLSDILMFKERCNLIGQKNLAGL